MHSYSDNNTHIMTSSAAINDPLTTDEPTSSSESSHSSSTPLLSSVPSSIRTVTLDELKDIDRTKPLNILVTIHDIKPFYNGVYVHGLGLWISYIIERYLVERNIPHKLYTKSVLTTGATKTSPKDFIRFVKRNKIDVVIPSDTTDTMFLSTHHAEISKHVNLAVTPSLSVYESLEDKWETYNMCKELNICTPDTTLFEQNNNNQHYPFFLKVASGTNAGRGVWHCKHDDDLKMALNQKEITRRKKDVVLIQQKPVSGDIITAQIIFDNGTPVGSFFCQSVQSENLAGMGANWVNSQRADIKDMVSDIKVKLTDKQSEVLSEIFTRIGNKTSYHGMMDIEFIVNPIDGIFLLECNPRFSGGLHTTLSNHKFLDLYFDVVNKKNRNNNNSEKKTLNEAPICGNYSAGVEMKARLGDFDPTGFYLKNPLEVLSLRHWFTENHITYRPKSPSPSPSPTSMKTTISTLLLKMDCSVETSGSDMFHNEYSESARTSVGSNSTIDSNQKMIHGM